MHGTRTTFEIQCWADTRASAESLAAAVKTVLDDNHQYCTGPAGGYDGELDLEAALLTCDRVHRRTTRARSDARPPA